MRLLVTRCRPFAAIVAVAAQLLAAGFAVPHCHAGDHCHAGGHGDGHCQGEDDHGGHGSCHGHRCDAGGCRHEHEHGHHGHTHHGHRHVVGPVKASIAAVHTPVCQPHQHLHAADASGTLGPHQHHHHEGHQHGPGCGSCFERHAEAAAVEGRSGDELSEAAVWLCCELLAVADEPACPPCEAGLQRQLAREAALAALSVHDFLPHVLRT